MVRVEYWFRKEREGGKECLKEGEGDK